MNKTLNKKANIKFKKQKSIFYFLLTPHCTALVISRNSSTTDVGPSPAPDLCMHIFRRAMPLWRVRRSASVAGGVVGALHVFLCFFHASFWQEGEQ